MPTFATRAPAPRANEQLTVAVENARRGRHEDDCVCGLYRRPDYRGYENAPFCSVEEFKWTVEIDRILERIRKASF